MENIVREPGGVQKWWDDYALSGENVVWREKNYSDNIGVYKNREACAAMGGRLAYRVANQNFHRKDFVPGNLQWGITYLEPGTVDGECNMTHGHFHKAEPHCDEYYFGISGEGFLLFWDGSGEFFAEKVFPGSLHYIDGKYAHRIINSGETLLAVAACSLPATKQDHAVIEETPFPYRCFKRDGKIEWIKE